MLNEPGGALLQFAAPLVPSLARVLEFTELHAKAALLLYQLGRKQVAEQTR